MIQLVTPKRSDRSPVQSVLLHRPLPQPLASNSPLIPPSNAVPMGKAGDHCISQALC